MTTTIITAPTTTNDFKTSLSLQVKKPSARSVASSLPDAVSEIAEARYWANKFGMGPSEGSTPQYAHPRKLKLQAGTASIVHQLEFGPLTKSTPLAVASGPRVRIYGTTPQSMFHRTLDQNSTNEVTDIAADKQVQTGGHLATAIAYRHDGRLLAVGTDNGQVRVADVNSRATLCTFATTLPIRHVSWLRDGQKIMCTGDDAVVRVFPLAQGAVSSQKPLLELRGHGDAIRSAALWQASTKDAAKWPHAALAFTGSYDHTIRIWKLDGLEENSLKTQERCLAVLSHDAPVQALQLLPSSNPLVPVWLCTAGGTNLKVWNPLTGQLVCDIPTQHRKTITSLLLLSKVTSENTVLRVMTAGLDGLLRIHSWDSATGKLHHLHGIDLHTPITALAVNHSSTRIAMGTIDGNVIVRQKGPSMTVGKRQREPRAGTYSFFTRGRNADAATGDYVVETSNKKRKLAKYDLALKQFRYGDALDEALETRIPQVVVAVLEELGRRRGLTIALSNRDEESLEPVLSFTVRYIARPRFSALLIGVANLLVDIYGNVSGESEVIDELFVKLKNQVAAEGRAQRILLRVMGQLDAITAAAERDESIEE